MTGTRRGAAYLLVLGIIVMLGWFIYAPALGGALLLDDAANLRGLADVEDGISALLFIFSGEAGPLGRPVALATFAAQAEAWGAAPVPLLRVNILIHVGNACLLAWVLYRLSRWSGIAEDRRWFLVLAATAIWLFMPLLASSSLMIVQRMTTLSATFVLLALGGYLQAREGLERTVVGPLVLMGICIALGTALAVLTKESGALLPVYVLALETTLLPRPDRIGRRWHVWKAIFLVLPTVLIVGYLGSRVPYAPELVLKRDFTGWERLLTESRILWQYLFNAFIPQPGEFGPFHDGYDAVRTILNPVTLAAFAGWTALLMLAILWRRKYPLFAFAVLWFIGGHLLESTLIPLELYFEHRNYLPIVGPVFALCAALMRLQPPRHKLAYVGLSAYILLNALVLFMHTTLWGDPPAAARYWQERFPDSVRAATTAARYRLNTDDLAGTLQGLSRLANENPTAGFVKIPGLSLACVTAPEADHSDKVAELHSVLKNIDFNYTVVTMLSQLFTTATSANCQSVQGGTVRALARTLLSNRRYRNDPHYNHLHHQLMARTLRHEGKYDEAIRHLQAAMEYQASADLNMMMVTTYADAGDLDDARTYIEKARQLAPWQPMKRFVWLTRLDMLSRYIENLSARRTAND